MLTRWNPLKETSDWNPFREIDELNNRLLRAFYGVPARTSGTRRE
ncbi:MAG TPA: hypothetical protein VNO52_01380 [Methylomirabilota bacterium]|nr:hypothetical protein [Methylomirabilota bacterium]